MSLEWGRHALGAGRWRGGEIGPRSQLHPRQEGREDEDGCCKKEQADPPVAGNFADLRRGRKVASGCAPRACGKKPTKHALSVGKLNTDRASQPGPGGTCGNANVFW